VPKRGEDTQHPIRFRLVEEKPRIFLARQVGQVAVNG
jgi:hypothetical protein